MATTNDLIKKHFHHYHQSGLRSSATNYAETGKVSGSLYASINNFAQDIREQKNEWYKKENRPKRSVDGGEYSIQVLIRCLETNLYSIGWFHFIDEKWSHLGDEEITHLEWMYLPK
jgi:hypothetical protein